MRRSVVFCLAAGVAFGAGELVLRLQDSMLPSMRGGLEAFLPSERPAVVALEADLPGCVETDTNGAAPKAWGMRVGEGVGPAHKLLFAGDSVTLGQGVKPAETYAVLLGTAYAETKGVAVEVVNSGVNAAGYCGVIRSVHHHHAHESFERTVVTLFADDLEQRAVVLEGDRIRANPRQLSGAVARAATWSHLINWFWHLALSQSVKRVTEAGESPPAHVTLPGRTVPRETLLNLERSIQGLSGIAPLWLLVPPAGLSLCPERPDPRSECGWMAADLERIAAVLNASGEEWVDLRSIKGSNYILNIERAWWERDGRLPVHPNQEGHRALAAAAASAMLNP
jgi:lysophospholipase L1-like esterase